MGSDDRFKPVTPSRLIDAFGRHINYLRLSITDRCNLRCFYCIGNPITRPTRHEVLSIEELELISRTLIKLGIDKIRITGGEPLVRRGALQLIESLGKLDDLNELALTTNGVQLAKHAQQIRDAGIERLNISLDTLQSKRFRDRTGGGHLIKVLEGIEAARKCGFNRIKLNTLVTSGDNVDEVTQLIDFATQKGLDITFIEEMPLGMNNRHNPLNEGFVSSQQIRDMLPSGYRLIPTGLCSGGPARYYRLANSTTDSLIGFISARSEHFCSQCNRIRLTATGQMVLCLGHPYAVDLRTVIRDNPGEEAKLIEAIHSGIVHKPWSHHFDRPSASDSRPPRPINATGG